VVNVIARDQLQARRSHMKVLTIYAHPNHKSFNYSVLERFTAGLREAGHQSEVIDLYSIGFNPVYGDNDFGSYITENVPVEVLERTGLRQSVLDSCRNPLQRFLVRRWMRDKDLPTIAKAVHGARPKDVISQQKKVAAADALAFIAPIYFVGFPAMLKGWIERVFTLGFAYELSAAGWSGDVNGRIPLLTHKRALVMTSTIFDEESYRTTGIKDAIGCLLEDWCLRFPGIEEVEHVYFHAVHDGNSEKLVGYLKHAYQLGKDFAAKATSSVRETSVPSRA
jgi:NAD(P)H dehydrogenase (quinone)